MPDFLTAVSSKKITKTQNLVQEVGSLDIGDNVKIDSADSALEALKSQPSRNTISSILRHLTKDGFSLILPEPLNASIAYQLVNDTIPNYWRTLSDAPESKLIAQLLRNPTGLGHIITRLRTLIADSRLRKAPNDVRNTLEHIEDILDVIDRVLRGNDTSRLVLRDVSAYGKSSNQKKLIWREYLAQTASGRLLSLTAEAEDALKEGEVLRISSWIADGKTYATWLGHNAVNLMLSEDTSDEHSTASTEFCTKLLVLGYTDYVLQSMLSVLVKDDRIERFANLLASMKGFEQRKYINATMTFVAHEHLSSESSSKYDRPVAASRRISGAAGFITQLIKNNDALKDHLVSILIRSTISILDDSLAVRRSIIAALSKDKEKLHTLLENAIKLFGDSIYIKHTPIMQQEALAQTLAICSGYVLRTQPMFLTMMAKSTYHINGMSNRIGAASARTRFLGIAVGIAISKMVDKPELQLKFDLEGAEDGESKWYQQLTKVNDKVGSIQDLASSRKIKVPAGDLAKSKPKPAPKAPRSQMIQGPRVIEILSDDEDDDDDLLAYEKPDSDPEDDTDDPTAVNRNKPTATVYIRDLIAGLRDQENYDRHELALSTAASLIRRKANFGTEVTDHLDELAAILTGLQDNSELAEFAQQRQQSLIAVLLAKPAEMAQWFARSFFSGDYSLTQRIAMLTTLGLGARELAGMKDLSTDELIPTQPSFPSKRLPPNLHKIYAEDNNAPTVAKISSNMARQMLSPIASQAADQLSGPNILKVRTFSSRMEVEKKRHKPIPNALAQIVADNFFFPLTGRWWLQIRAKSDSVYTSMHLLPPFLRTLSILLNASGPNTLALPQMTREYWDLLLSVRGLAGKDKNVLNAVLFGFLMILETNENKERLATEQGKELMETQAWVKMVFEGLGAGSEEDERVRVLAAGVVVRCQEVVEKYQRRMAGALMDY
ncbi:hypothetical protein T440DRAFT_413901 [Plenodomus tracheiphilus IPT5]|uniref:Telomere length regulation protein conserved domain-containing protein n=1 Tax=Plenodomus tracheiphilus IPT5 TaxID=1408161 RepID=A0A6A7BIW2_9PLEO|nr:hypothetical protein T440DRAFT_413901 [Plenodomus tracheiphilus IPT5]